MIHRSIEKTNLNDYKIEQYIWYQGNEQDNLISTLKQLYQSTYQQNRSIYGIKIYQSTPTPTEPNNKNKIQQLRKIKLQQKKKIYISWCYYFFNWQNVSIQNLNNYINSLPMQQNQIQEIRVEGTVVKFYKYDKCLSYDLSNRNKKIQNARYFMDSFDPTGKNKALEYQSSLCKITVGNVGYRFDGLVRIVQSCEGYAAVATVNSIYIIPLKLNTGNSYKFDIAGCVDMKWSNRGLFFLQKSQYVGLIQRQTTYIPKMNGFTLHSIYQLTQFISNEYTPQRIGIASLSGINYNLVLLSVSQNNPKRYNLHILDSSKYCPVGKLYLPIQLKQVKGQIVYKNIIMVNNQLILVTISGYDGNIENINWYKFGTI